MLLLRKYIVVIHSKMQSETAEFAPGAATSRTERNIRRARLLWFGPISGHYTKMTSSTKPEVHNASHCRQRRTEPRPQVTGKGWSLDVWSLRYASGQTNRQTYRHAVHSISHPYWQGKQWRFLHSKSGGGLLWGQHKCGERKDSRSSLYCSYDLWSNYPCSMWYVMGLVYEQWGQPGGKTKFWGAWYPMPPS